jgi:hypothetical protein
MKPLKFSNIIIDTAKRSGASVEIVEAFLRVYFKDLRAALTSLSHVQVKVMNLGTFCVKPHTLEKRLERRYELLRKLRDDPERSGMIREEVLLEINQIESSLELVRDERMRKGAVKKHRRSSYEQKDQSDHNMEETG